MLTIILYTIERKYHYYHHQRQSKIISKWSKKCQPSNVTVIMLQSLNVAHSIWGAAWQSPEQAHGHVQWIAAPMAFLLTSTMHQFVTTVLPREDWHRLERLPLSEDLCPSPVRKIWQLWIERYTHIPAVALVTVHFRSYSKAASVVEMFSTRLQDFWANSCFLAALTLLRSLVLLYVSKTKRSIISIVLSLIWSAMYTFFTCFSDLGYTSQVTCAVFYHVPANETLCRTLQERGTDGEYQL